ADKVAAVDRSSDLPSRFGGLAGADADVDMHPLAGGETEGANGAGPSVAVGIDAHVGRAAAFVERAGDKWSAVVAVGGFELEEVAEVARAEKAGIGAHVEGILKSLIDALMTQANDPFRFGALAIGVGCVAVAVPPALGRVVVAERIAKQSAAFI